MATGLIPIPNPPSWKTGLCQLPVNSSKYVNAASNCTRGVSPPHATYGCPISYCNRDSKYLCTIVNLSLQAPLKDRRAVGTITMLWGGQLGLDSKQGQMIPPFSKTPKLYLGFTQPPMQRVPQCLSTGTK